MKHISLNESYLSNFVTKTELDSLKISANDARKALIDGTGKGAEWRGWVDLPINYDKKEFSRIKAAARKIRSQSRVLVVIGIGGSYLGARAAIEFLKPGFGYGGGTSTEIYYVGNNLSTAYLNCVCGLIGDRDFSINVISKSGTTTEPAVAFRFFKHFLERHYGKEEARDRIYVTTDKECGALRELANREGYETFEVPRDIGGRFSMLTAVGLLPIAVAGINVDHLMRGAAAAREELIAAPFKTNMAMRYAAIRYWFYRKKKSIEILANYDPSFAYIAEWWKQLYGESEGKHHKGLFPASVNLTTDLHSLGQFIQDGPRMMMETVLDINDTSAAFKVTKARDDFDGLNYLAGKTLKDINACAMEGTIKAHVEGGVPVTIIGVDSRTAEALGELVYFFEFACGVSGYMLGLNPFDQPGVEAYKRNMFALLGKPGY